LSEKEVEEACTIRVEIQPLKREGKKDYEYSKTSSSSNVPAVAIFHQDSKPVLWG
jgi:hypothetical protein